MEIIIPIIGTLLIWAAAYMGFWRLVQRRLVESTVGILLTGVCVYFGLWWLAPVAAVGTAIGLIRRCGPYHALPALLLLTLALAFLLTGAVDLPPFSVLGINVSRGVVGGITSLATLAFAVLMCAEVLVVHRGGDRRAAHQMMVSLLLAPVFPTESPLQRFLTDFVSSLRARQIVQGGRVVHSLPPSEDFRMPGPGILIIRSGNAAVLERAGKITRIVGPGLHLTEAWEHLCAIVDLSQQTGTWKLENVSTRDCIRLEVELTVEYSIMVNQHALVTRGQYKLDEDIIRRSVLTTPNWKEKTEKAAERTLRSVMATRSLDQVRDPEGRDSSNGAVPCVPLGDEIRRRLSRESQQWGVEIASVGIDRITMPEEIQQRIDELRSAEIKRRTAEVEARITYTEAAARAKARSIESQADAAAEAERWRAVIHSLQKDLLLDPKTISQVALKLAGVLTTVDDFQAMVRFFNLPPSRIIGGEKPAESEQSA
jgi:regulator of protease activity HflC (stomatin/prohibitin superfamily)